MPSEMPPKHETENTSAGEQGIVSDLDIMLNLARIPSSLRNRKLLAEQALAGIIFAKNETRRSLDALGRITKENTE